ncbi:hypothetical protein [uncultured Eubacterium sp.]|uniref:hypothetical protein n=1 Tax=uncultured Eubacterium sp. TaxID=165185 RepID=UPI0025FEEC0C|nr:hypothetical protein [uncultured Eubacterium sp.]
MIMNVDKICGQLTIEEKIRLLGGVGDWHTYDCNGKIPSVMMTDGPHGIRKLEQEKVGDIETSKPATCFPPASAIACSWNPELVKKMGEGNCKGSKKRTDFHGIRMWDQYQAFPVMRKEF